MGRTFVIRITVSLLLPLGGCGPSAPSPAAATQRPASPSSKRIDEGTAATPPIKAETDHHRDFIEGCGKRPINTAEYCECAWGEFRKAFTDDEMNAKDLAPIKREKVKNLVARACSTKIPEESVREAFANGCGGDRAEMKPYCLCTWTEFRKRFSPAEIADEGTVTSERFTAARAPVVKACASKMPEGVSQAAFLKACVKDASAEKFCGCAWKELRKQASPAEIEAGTFDQKVLFAQVEKACSALRPAKP